MAVEAEEVADVVIWNVERVAVGVFPVLPPSALLSRGARGVAAPWWGSPPTKSAKVLRRFIIIEEEKSNNTKYKYQSNKYQVREMIFRNEETEIF